MSFKISCVNKKSSYRIHWRRGSIVRSSEKFASREDLEFYEAEGNNHELVSLAIVNSPVILEISEFDLTDRDLTKAALDSIQDYLATMTLRHGVPTGNKDTPKRCVYLPVKNVDEIRFVTPVTERNVIEKIQRFCKKISVDARVFVDFKVTY